MGRRRRHVNRTVGVPRGFCRLTSAGLPRTSKGMSKDFQPRPGRPGKPAHRRFHNKPPKPAPGTRDDGRHVLYGIHTVVEALKNPQRRFVKLVGTENGIIRLREGGSLPLEPRSSKPTTSAGSCRRTPSTRACC